MNTILIKDGIFGSTEVVNLIKLHDAQVFLKTINWFSQNWLKQLNKKIFFNYFSMKILTDFTYSYNALHATL